MSKEISKEDILNVTGSMFDTFLDYVDNSNNELEQLKQENQQLKDEINKISKKELKIMQMLRSIELCTLTKERIDQIEEVMFELNTDDLLKGDKE